MPDCVNVTDDSDRRCDGRGRRRGVRGGARAARVLLHPTCALATLLGTPLSTRACSSLLVTTYKTKSEATGSIMVRRRTFPGEKLTQQILLGSAWLAFIYMLLLTLFELIELLRPIEKYARCEPRRHRSSLRI